jgi:hypothetical protein
VNWATFVIQWLHVLLGILWFGNALVLVAIELPVLNGLPLVVQRDIGQRLGQQSARVFTIVAPAVIVLGIVRGTVLGPIRSVDDLLGTAYGLTWLVALIASVATLLWGRLIIMQGVRAMDAVPLGPGGTPTPELEAATSRVKLLAVLELAGFTVVFTCMILMRFGL